MDTDLRASLVAAAAAAVLSALVGVIAGVGVVALLLRAVLGGALFGALVYGGIFLARRFLPGLSRAGERASADRLDEEERGRAVDIVLPGEGPTGEALAEEVPEDTRRGTEAPAEALAAAAEEVAPRPAPHRAAKTDEVRYIDQEEEPEDLEGLIGPEGSSESGAAIPAAAPGISSFDDLDVLPDLEGFSDSFAPAEIHGVSGESSVSVAPRSSPSQGSPMTESLDPVSLAHAVRTILKRDQKG